jgi:hypothetical protein
MTREQCWRVNAPDVISETIDGETIILHLGNGFYFSVGGCGPEAWRMLSTSAAFGEVVASLESVYEANGTDVAAEVERFVSELTDESLLVPAEAVAPQEGAVGGRASEHRPFEPPTLAKFTDMEDLLLLDPVHEVSPQQGWPHAAPESTGT